MLVVILFISACDTDRNEKIEDEYDNYIIPSQIIQEFDNDLVKALEKYEKGEDIYLKNVFLIAENYGSDVYLYDSKGLNSYSGFDSIYIDDSDNELDDYLYRLVDIKVKFIEYHEAMFGSNLEFQVIEVIKVIDVDVTITLEELNDLSQSEYYSIIDNIISIEGVYDKPKYGSATISNVDESVKIILKDISDNYPNPENGDVIEVIGYFIDGQFEADAIYVSSIVINED